MSNVQSKLCKQNPSVFEWKVNFDLSKTVIFYVPREERACTYITDRIRFDARVNNLCKLLKFKTL